MKVECPACSQPFNSTCYPVQLPCGHIYCIHCVKNTCADFEAESILCPACGDVSPAPESMVSLEGHEIILDLLKDPPKLKPEVECSECDEKCLNSCSDCPDKPPLCTRCFELMHQTAKRKTHKLGPLVARQICSIHDKPMELICNTCNTPICQLCVISGSHKNHKVAVPGDISNYTIKLPHVIATLEREYALSRQDLLEKQVHLVRQEQQIEAIKEANMCSDPIEFVLKYSHLVPTESKILMVGLDGSGKTTLLYRICLEQSICTVPTIGFNVETVSHQNNKLTIWDVGGQEKIRPLWRHYYGGTQGIIFVIDSSSHDRIIEAKDELTRLLFDEGMRYVPLLIFANKQDLFTSMTSDEVAQLLDLSKFPLLQYSVQSICATSGEGISDGLHWLCSAINSH